MIKKIQTSPRKSPVQARSLATVEVIFEATIQVLASQGLAQLTTARVAERAGLSVGSVYQYFPNKHALLIAVLTRHLQSVIHAVEAVCREQHRKSLEQIARAVASGFVAVKMQRPEVSRALYALPSDKETDAIIASATARGQLAIRDLLASCTDAQFQDLSLIASVFVGSLIGPVQMMLTGAIPLERQDALTEHLVQMSTAYLNGAALRSAITLSKAPSARTRHLHPK